MKAPSGHIIVKGKKFDETFTTESGMTFYNYIQKGKETSQVNYFAEVVAVPDHAGIGDDGLTIEHEVQVGDKVYFHYNSLLSDENWIPSACIGESEDEPYWRVHYFDVMCVVRNGEIIPIGGWCLVEPHIDKFESEVLEYALDVKNETQGILRAIGTPKRGQETPSLVNIGDTVFFEQHDAFENEIEGEKYYCMQQNRILARI